MHTHTCPREDGDVKEHCYDGSSAHDAAKGDDQQLLSQGASGLIEPNRERNGNTIRPNAKVRDELNRK